MLSSQQLAHRKAAGMNMMAMSKHSSWFVFCVSLRDERQLPNTSVSILLITSHLNTLKYIKNLPKCTLESSVSNIQSQQSLHLSQR